MVCKLDVPGRQEELQDRMQEVEEIGDLRPPVAGMGECPMEEAETSVCSQSVRLQRRTLQGSCDHDNTTATMEVQYAGSAQRRSILRRGKCIPLSRLAKPGQCHM